MKPVIGMSREERELIDRSIGIVAKAKIGVDESERTRLRHTFALLFWNVPGFDPKEYHAKCVEAREAYLAQEEINRGA